MLGQTFCTDGGDNWMTRSDFGTLAIGAVFGLLLDLVLRMVFHALQCPEPWIP
jgi:hypothetical protein